MKYLLILIAIISLIGCYNSKLFNDNPQLWVESQALANSYFEGQKNGEDTQTVAQKYWYKKNSWIAATFLNLIEYKFIKSVNGAFGPALKYRVKAGNNMGGMSWNTYDVYLGYEKDIGVKIKSISESSF